MRQIVTAVLTVLLLATAAAAADELIVIAHPTTPVATITAREAREIFLGFRRTWPGGFRVIPLAQRDAKLTEAFCEQMMSSTVQQYYLHWRKAIFTGKGSPPLEVDNDTAMKQLVARTPGAIGYIRAKALDDTVKLLAVR